MSVENTTRLIFVFLSDKRELFLRPYSKSAYILTHTKIISISMLVKIYSVHLPAGNHLISFLCSSSQRILAHIIGDAFLATVYFYDKAF